MTECPGWDATIFPSRLANVRQILSASLSRLGSDPFREGALASSLVRTGPAITLALGLLAFTPTDGSARRGSPRSSGLSPRMYASHPAYRSCAGSSHGSTKCLSCECDRHGRVQRDRSPVEDFKRMHPRPPGCRGCEVDHIVALGKGGRDDPSAAEETIRRHSLQARDSLNRRTDMFGCGSYNSPDSAQA